MANVLAELFQNTANAIREKTGSDGTMKPAEFPEKIRGITVTEEPDLEELTVTENGVYSNAIIYGKTYTFKDALTTEELRAIDKMAAGEDFEVKKLYTSADGTVILDTYVDIVDGYAMLGFTSGSDRFNYYDERAAAFWQQSKGWTKLDGNNVVSVEPPTMVFEENGTLYVPSIEDLSELFPLADGYSKITVNVPSAKPKLVPLTVTENGTYYPTGNIEHGKTYTLRSAFTQEELQAFYETSLSHSEDGMYAFLCENNDGMLGIMYAYGYYGVYISDGHLWLPEEFASAMGFASGWNFGTDISALAPAETPSFSFAGAYELFLNEELNALNGLFDLPPSADGFSSVEVNVASASVDGVQAYTVTYVGADGTVLHTKPTVAGDDTYNPYALNKIEKPTKESTEQYNYEFNGWSLTADGTASAAALERIQEDRTLYAAFKASTRIYTVRFLDGETVLSEQQIAYGGTATPPDSVREGCIFNGWTPSDFTITADTDFYGEWVEGVAFESATWAQIAAVADSGQASSIFNIGDERTIKLTWEDGTTEDCVIRIAAFNADTIYDEDTKTATTKAGISFDTKGVISKTTATGINSSTWYNYNPPIRQFMQNTVYPALPSDLKEVIKTTIVPSYDKYCVDKISLLSAMNVGVTYNDSYYNYNTDFNSAYPVYGDRTKRDNNGIAKSYALCDKPLNYISNKDKNSCGVGGQGNITSLWATDKFNVAFRFAI